MGVADAKDTTARADRAEMSEGILLMKDRYVMTDKKERLGIGMDEEER
jgi:hypothetical protein